MPPQPQGKRKNKSSVFSFNYIEIRLLFLFCRLGIDEELVTLLGKHSPVRRILKHNYDSNLACINQIFRIFFISTGSFHPHYDTAIFTVI